MCMTRCGTVTPAPENHSLCCNVFACDVCADRFSTDMDYARRIIQYRNMLKCDTCGPSRDDDGTCIQNNCPCDKVIYGKYTKSGHCNYVMPWMHDILAVMFATDHHVPQTMVK